MDTIRLTTWINAPVERCFKLSTSIELHLASTAPTGEVSVKGVIAGLVSPGATVTWRGRHFGMRLCHTSRVDAWRPYSYFRDVMVEGAFSRFEHEHFFAAMNDGTRMRDEVRFSAPLGALGLLASRALVRRHLNTLLARRNRAIKRLAESNEWHRYLDGAPEMSKVRLDERV